MKKFFAILLLLPLSQVLAAADYRYVTDQFKIMLRTGESATHKITRTLPSGTRLQIIKDNPETGYSQVRTPNGKEGYVLTRQLMDDPSAREKLQRAEARLEELQQAPGKLSAKLSKLQQEHEELLKQHEAVQLDKKNIEQELSGIKRTASNAIRVTNERKELRQQVTDLTREVENLKQENRELGNDSNQDWFLIGGGVIIIGILIGLVLPHLRVQRRRSGSSSWDSF
ncbi:MAG: TIGR04211 family SH3 domain-containing protein [Chromatiales bacterium]